jgi:hypothetical protein
MSGTAKRRFGYIVTLRAGFSNVVVNGIGAAAKATAKIMIPKVSASLLMSAS